MRNYSELFKSESWVGESDQKKVPLPQKGFIVRIKPIDAINLWLSVIPTGKLISAGRSMLGDGKLDRTLIIVEKLDDVYFLDRLYHRFIAIDMDGFVQVFEFYKRKRNSRSLEEEYGL